MARGRGPDPPEGTIETIKNHTDMKTFTFAILSILLLATGIVLTHYLLFAWSFAADVLAFVCLGIFAWQCDRQSAERRG